MSRESCIKVLQDVFERDMACVGITLTHEALEAVIEYLKDVPSADVHPVTPMHWTPINPFNGGWSDVWRCSACGSQVSLGYCTDVMEYDFCPYCGARKGEQND